jgi:hypothetical protein
MLSVLLNLSSLLQAIAVHTFVIVWWHKGLLANNVARLCVIASWIYGISYVATIGSLHRSEPDSIFRPTPVRIDFVTSHV